MLQSAVLKGVINLGVCNWSVTWYWSHLMKLFMLFVCFKHLWRLFWISPRQSLKLWS